MEAQFIKDIVLQIIKDIFSQIVSWFKARKLGSIRDKKISYKYEYASFLRVVKKRFMVVFPPPKMMFYKFLRMKTLHLLEKP